MSGGTLIRVGARPRPWTGTGEFFDGRTAIPRQVGLKIDEEARALLISSLPTGLERPPVRWRLDDIRLVPDQAGKGPMLLRDRGDPVARLSVQDRTLAARCDRLHRSPQPVPIGRITAWAAAAVASVGLIIFALVPLMADQLARYIPPEGERALGEATLGQIRGALGGGTAGMRIGLCEAPAGLAALRHIERRLAPDAGTGREISALVLDHGMINAFALPGGYVVFFRGLIDAAETPEEVAAVFAHEIGHVVSRDPTRNALRSTGSIGVLGLLFGDFAGGAAVLLLTERLISASYSQKAEAAADTYAYAALQRAGVAPAALGDMFEHLRDRYGDVRGVQAHFLSHPSLASRIEAARAATPTGFAAAPIIPHAEWAALKHICD